MQLHQIIKQIAWASLILAAPFSSRSLQAQSEPLVPHLTDNTKQVIVPKGFITDRVSDGMILIAGGANNTIAYINDEGDYIFGYDWHPTSKTSSVSNNFNNSGCVVLNSDKKHVILHKDGSVMPLPQEYIKVSDFSDGIASVLVRNTDKKGYSAFFIDIDGNKVLPSLNSSAQNDPLTISPVGALSEDRRAYQDISSSKWGYADGSGQIVIPPRFDRVADFHEGLAAVCENNLWGYVDNQGNYVIQPQFKKQGYDFKEGFAVVCQKGYYYFINPEGVIVTPEPGYVSASNFEDGIAIVEQKGDKGYAYHTIDKNFQILSTPDNPDLKIKSFANFFPFYDGLTATGLIGNTYDSGCGVIINNKGEVIIRRGEYPDRIHNFHEGKLAKCRIRSGKDFYEGYINRNAEFVFIFVEDPDYINKITPSAKTACNE